MQLIFVVYATGSKHQITEVVMHKKNSKMSLPFWKSKKGDSEKTYNRSN